MTKYKVHVYKLASKFEVPIEADNPEIAMEEALKIAKDPKRASEFYQHVEFLVMPFEVTVKPEEPKKKKKGIILSQQCVMCYSYLAVENEEYCEKCMKYKPNEPDEDHPDDYDIPDHTD